MSRVKEGRTPSIRPRLRGVLLRGLLAGLLLGLGFGAGSAGAVTLVPVTLMDTVGDDDCFGLGGGCPDGSLYVSGLGGSFFDDLREVDDPDFTDHWSDATSVTYNHEVDLSGVMVTSGVLEVRFAGVADQGPDSFPNPDRGPWDVYVNGILLADQIDVNTLENANEMVVTYSFDVTSALLPGTDTVVLDINNALGADDRFNIDFSKLTVEGTTVIPEPTSAVVFAAGMLVVAGSLRSRRS